MIGKAGFHMRKPRGILAGLLLTAQQLLQHLRHGGHEAGRGGGV